jgi:predicted permease
MTGVFAQSLANIGRLDLGVDIDSVVMFSLSRPAAGGAIDPGFLPRLVEALETMPGVSSVASAFVPVLSLERQVATAALEGMQAEELPVSRNFVSSGFFGMFGIELLAGREFEDAEMQVPTARPVAIVNQRFAERFGLPPDALVGRSVDAGSGRINERGEFVEIAHEIVGVVADVRSGKVTDEIEPQLFLPALGGTFYVRGARPSEDLLNAVRETVARVDSLTAATNLRTMEQQFRENIAIERFFAGTSTAFAVLATALAALGLYGVLAFSVAQRSREIGLRIALGAAASRVRGMVLRQVVGMAVIGIVVGAAAAVVLGRAAQSLLFGVEASDPLALAAAAVLLAGVTLGAAYLPARRASRVDPMTVLRYE